MTRSPGIALYNQDRFDDGDFVANFVARNEQVTALLNSLRHIARGGPTEHQILIGARGMGKTSLLRRIAIGVMGDPELAAVFIPLRFREEQYNIISLDAFWRNCGESLAEFCEQQGNQSLADRLDIAIETPEWRNEDQARDAFLAACREAGGRAILLLDNLDLILEGIKIEGCWKLRATLQQQSGPVVIGAATQLLAQGADRDLPFYEFFNPHMLEPLSERDLLACLNALADLRGMAGAQVRAILAREPERIRTLYVLTGGNPRVLALVYQLLEQSGSDTIFADLEALLDQVTPFYKARIEEYQTPLQRAVIDGIALNWDPITSGALSKETGVEVTTLSAQLARLKRDGLIEEVETSGAKAGYQLAERFLNIWYLMRNGTRKTKQRLRWFTIFLTKLFSADELQRMAGDARQGGGGRWHPDHCDAVIEAYELKLQNETSDLRTAADELWSAALELGESGSSTEAIAAYDKVVAHVGESDAADLQLQVARALVNKGVTLGRLMRSEDEIAVYDEVVARFGASSSIYLQEPVTRALVYKGHTLRRLGRAENAIAVYDEVVARVGESDIADVHELVAMALVNKGASLGTLGRSEDAIDVLDEVVTRFGESNAPGLQLHLAMALFNKGIALGKLMRSKEEIATYDDVVARFGGSEATDLRREVAIALVNKGVTLCNLARSEEAIAVYDEVVVRFGESNTDDLQQQVAMALVNKGISLSRLGRFDDEIVAYDELVARFGKNDNLDFKRRVAKALLYKGSTLSTLGRSDDEVAVYDEVVARFGASDAIDLQRQVAMALINKGNVLGTLDRSGDALGTYRKVVVRFGATDDDDLRRQVAIAQVIIGTLLFWDLGQEQEGLSAVLQAIEADPDDLFAKANLLWIHAARGELAEAKAISAELGDIADGGRSLMLAALDLAADNMGDSLAQLSKALDQGLSGKFDYAEDLIWYLRIAVERGYGERLIEWFVKTGNADRYAPVYGAFVAHVRGERFLLDLNPEVRGVAQPMYARLSAGQQQKPSKKKGRGKGKR